MQIKTPEGERNVASQAVAGTALGLAIPGTLSFLNQLGVGGILNGGRTTTECADTRTISALTSELGKEKAERYADGIGISSFKEAQALNEKTNDRVLALERFTYELDKKYAVEQQEIRDNFKFLNYKIDKTKDDVMCYVNATFVPGKLVMPLDSICPPAEPATTTTT